MLNRISLLAVSIAFAACLTACFTMDKIPPSAGEMTREVHTIDLGKAEKLEANIDFPAGELEVLGGAVKLVEGEYRFNSDSLRPVIGYRESAGVGRLDLNAAKKASFGNAKGRWQIRLNDATPLSLELRMGAGKAEINLGTLSLRTANVHFGAGEMTLDLRGKPRQGYTIEVHGGVGHGRIYIPGGAGVHANVSGGIGEISTQGDLRKDGHDYYNGLWNKAERKVELTVRGGVGKIELIAAE